MDNRNSFTDLEYSLRKQAGRREKMLTKLDEIIPWDEMEAIVEPYYPSGRRGRPVKPLKIMLRMYFVQNWFGLSGSAIEDAVYDSYAIRKFVGITFWEEQAPDANTLYRFKRLLKKNGLDQRINELAKEKLDAAGVKVFPGKISEPFLKEKNSTRSK